MRGGVRRLFEDQVPVKASQQQVWRRESPQSSEWLQPGRCWCAIWIGKNEAVLDRTTGRV